MDFKEMIMLKFLLLFKVSLIGVLCIAQNNIQMPALLPVTPNIASLYKGVDQPIGTFTGTTPIDVPVYEMKSGDESIYLSLSYNNGGVKVEEIAGNVGLGWAFLGIGNVTRILRGLPDETGYLNSSIKPSEFHMATMSQQIEAAENRLDVEPDLFLYNFKGRSGKFFFDEEGKVVEVVPSGLDIKPLLGTTVNAEQTIDGWIIRDESGLSYYFGTDKSRNKSFIDYTSTYSSEVLSNTYTNYVSSWHVAEVYSINELRLFSFDYTINHFEFSLAPTESMRLLTLLGGPCGPQLVNTSSVLSTVMQQVPKTIHSLNETLYIHTSNNRQDGGDYRIDSLSVLWGNEIRYKYLLGYDYFVSDGSNPSNEVYTKRLKLSSFVQLDINRKEHSFDFDYEETIKLPHRFSKAIDYWGFYNGQNLNSTRLPNVSYQGYGQTVNVRNLADRRSNAFYAKAFSLNRIKYPTGGYREFIYEGNTALISANTSDIEGNTKLESIYSGLLSLTYVDEYTPLFSEDFVINNNGEDYTSFRFDLRGGCSIGNFTIKIIVNDEHGEGVIRQFINEINGETFLPNGNYRIELFVDAPCELMDLSCSWEESTSVIQSINYGGMSQAMIRNVGGLRVKELVDFDILTNVQNVTTYSYDIFNNPGITSGLLISPVKFVHAGSCPDASCRYLILSSSSHYPLSSHSGSYVVYPNVTTRDGEKGWREQTFSFAYDGPFDITSVYDPIVRDLEGDFPIRPLLDNSYKRGQVIVDKIFSKNGALLKKKIAYYALMETASDISDDLVDYGDFSINMENEVNVAMTRHQYAWKVFGIQSIDNNGVEYMSNVCMSLYTMGSNFPALLMEANTSYSNGNKIDDVQVYYKYWNNMPFIKEVRSMKGGREDIDSRRYVFNAPEDFIFGISNNEQLLKEALLEKNYLMPIETARSFKIGGVLKFWDGNKLVFSSNSTGQRINLERIKAYNTPTLYNEVIFSQYTTDDKILERSVKGNYNEVYLWGYKSRYPVAKIIGSDWNAIKLIVDTALLNNGTEGQMTTQLMNLRAAVANNSLVQIHTYTYKPLVGITSETDASGRVTYYEYDDFNRLYIIKDQDGRVLKKYCYNYAGQVDDCSATTAANWQNTATAIRCKKIAGNQNTGEQEREQRDMNVNSPTYNQLRWIVTGMNLTACPLPAPSCPKYKIEVDGVIEDLYVKYSPCAGSGEVIVAFNSLPAHAIGYTILCSHTMPVFRIGYMGFDQIVSGVTVNLHEGPESCL